MRLQENTTFANRYQLERLLGRGGFSEVWLAKDNWTHLRIALKVYAPGQGMDANGLQDFCGELANVFDLNHTNLLKPTHVDSWNDMPYLIMAYCSNGSLASKVGKLSEEEIWKLIHDVGAGLAYLHKRDVVHQDIKPDNILIDEVGNYVITDFGISTRARSTLRKSVVGGSASGGTTAYMGPERFSRQPAPTKASDVWSFGAMVYEVLEGIVPFGEVGGGLQKGGAEIPYISANVSDALKFTVYKMLSKETWDRPTAETLVAWSQNPQSIEVDNSLLAVEESASAPSSPEEEPKAPSRQTQRFSKPAAAEDAVKKEESKQQPAAKPAGGANKGTNGDDGSKIKKLILILVIIGTAFIGIGTVVGIGIHNHREAERRELRILYERHTDAIDEFDRCLNAASLDNIEALQQALDQLHIIKGLEDDNRFADIEYYYELRQSLLDKAQELYDKADQRYQLAPPGSEAERRNMQKRRQIFEIKQKI